MDWPLPYSTIQETPPPWWLIHRYVGLVLENWLTPPLGASLEGVFWGRSVRILLKLIIWRRKKLIFKLNDLFSFYYLPTSNAPKTMVLHFPPCLPTGAHPLHTPLRWGRLFLVGCCVSHCQLAAVQRQRCILYIIFFIAWVVAPNDGMVSPHALSCPRASTQTYPLPLPLPIGWLLVTVIERRPPKAKAPPISLFLMGLFLAPQTREQTMASANPTPCAFPGPIGSGGTTTWVRGGNCHGDRGQSWWRVRQQRLTLIVVCCGCSCDDHFSYLTGRKVEIGPAKMANFSAFIKKCITRCPQCKRMSKIVIVLRFWTFLDIWAERWNWSIMSAEKVCYFLPR